MKVTITLFTVLSFVAFASHAQDKNPYKSIGKKGKVITLTQGKYEESFDDDSIQQIGSALVNIRTMHVVKFELTKEEQRIIDETAVSRFLSVDPLTKNFAMLTPYQYDSNTPIAAIDIDGLEGLIASPLGDQNIISITTASEVNKGIIVNVFKATFSSELPKELVDHYAYGNGTPYHLNQKEMIQTNTAYTGLGGLVKTDNDKLKNLLSKAKRGEKISLPENYAIQGAAGTGGTLGRFRIELNGKIIIDKKDKSQWTFSGKMRFTDTWDFKTNPSSDNDLQRTDWGNTQTKIGEKYLPGKGFTITSDWVNVKQSSNDNYFDWFNGKPKYEDGQQNKVSNEMKNNPKVSNATQKSINSETNN